MKYNGQYKVVLPKPAVKQTTNLLHYCGYIYASTPEHQHLDSGEEGVVIPIKEVSISITFSSVLYGILGVSQHLASPVAMRTDFKDMGGGCT